MYDPTLSSGSQAEISPNSIYSFCPGQTFPQRFSPQPSTAAMEQEHLVSSSVAGIDDFTRKLCEKVD